MKALITGGAGFIGTNLSMYLAKNGWEVTVIDNLSRKGSINNLKFLKGNISKKQFKFMDLDIRDKVISKYVNQDAIFHMAAQTAVTSSITDPQNDFDVNAYGTFNILEAVRKKNPKAIFIYPSTNKVYGALENINKRQLKKGISELTNLDFHSPYGVSKGTADSYTKDYARVYNLSTVVFRQSCIYGINQLGVQDQGWTAHIGAKILFGDTVNVFGDGSQVRDLLNVDDLIEAYMLGVENIKKVKGMVFNIGGGIKNSISVKGYVDFVERETGKKAKIKRFAQRPGDQDFFVSDNTKITKLINWHPKTSYKTGLPIMLSWIKENERLFKSFK
jgi:CDP-paratose 2-epimerase